MIRYGENLAFARTFRIRNLCEVGFDECFDPFRIEISDSDHRHQIGPVPVFVEPGQSFIVTGIDGLDFPDGQSSRIPGTL